MSLFGGITLPGRPDLANVYRLHLLPVESITAMQRYGMAIDIPHLNALTETLEKECAELRVQICSEIPPEKLDEFIEKSNMDDEEDYLPMNVESTKQLRKLLFEVLGVGRGKELKLTKGGDISTGKRQLETHKRDHPVVQHVLTYREYSKLRGTYTEKMPREAVLHPESTVLRPNCPVCGLKHRADTMRVHTQIMSTRTSTSRFASKSPNLQNIPSRSYYGKKTRAGFVASPGTRIVDVDFSQCQLRIAADRANEKRMIAAFEQDKDLHKVTASLAFNIPEEQVTKDQRDPSRHLNFAILFGETYLGLYDQLVSDIYGKAMLPVPDWLTKEWCKEFHAKWFEIYSAIGPYMDTQYYRARRYGVVWDMFGWTRRVPEVRSAHRRIVAAGLRQAGNVPIQSPDAGWMRLAMAEVQQEVVREFQRENIWCWPLMTIHDQLLVECDEEYAELCKYRMIDIFEHVLTDRETGERLLRVPVKADGKITERWEK